MKQLADPWGSSPGRPPQFCLYVSRWRDDEDNNCQYVWTAAAPYAAHKLLVALLRDDEIDWLSNNRLRSSSGLEVRMPYFNNDYAKTTRTLKQLWEHDLTLPEMAWELDAHVARALRLMRDRRSADVVAMPAPERHRRETSAPRKQAPLGYVHVSEVALSMGIDAKEARVALRKIYAGAKPEHGWWFSPLEVDEVKAKIAEVLK